MQSRPIEEIVQAISREIDEERAIGADISGSLQALASELQTATKDAIPDVDAAIDVVVDLIETLGDDPDSQGGSCIRRIRECVSALQGLINNLGQVDDPILIGFLDDRADSLDELEDLVLGLEQSGNQENREGILRVVHSIKGDAGVLSLDDLSELCHKLETQLEGASNEEAARLTLEATGRMRVRFAQLASGDTAEPASKAQEEEPVNEDEFKLPDPDLMDDVDQELVAEFVVEAQEHLESIDSNLLVLGGNEAEREEAINAVFRAFHTIKGLSGFLNLNILMGLAHEAEAMLHRVRSDEITMSQNIVNAAFKVNDCLKGLVGSVDASLSSGAAIEAPESFPAVLQTLDDAANERGSIEDLVPAHGTADPEADSTASSSGSTSSFLDQSSSVRGTIKVDASRLDRLVDTIGELVIAEAMVNQCDEIPTEGIGRLPGLLGQLDKTTRELQEMAMSLRMVPIRSTFRRMARLARDVSHKLNKKIEFVTRGDDTELDKTVVDVIGDPLVHMVRNSIDHGIERSAEERERAGKPPIGRIELRAFHEGGSIHVEIQDDGRGLDRESILKKARAKGIVGEDTDNVSDSEVYGLIFAPGFSTAESVTEVSGRGVGLDVVRRNIESLRGRVEISSTPGQGSVFSIRLPLTLAIIDGMIVRAGRRRYIVPTLAIIRMFRPRPGDVASVLDRGHVLTVGEDLVSLHRLDEVLGLPKSASDVSGMSAIVVESSSGHFAFLVDELLGQHQIVIKPLGEALTGIPGFAGGAIMPDGTVGLILDIAGLVETGSSIAGAA